MVDDAKVKEVESLIIRLGERFGVDLELDAAKSCVVTVNDETAVLLDVANDYESIDFLTYAGGETSIYNPDSLKKVLSWNYTLAELRGCTVGYCIEKSRFILKTTEPLHDLDEVQMENMLGVFCSVQDTIVEEIRNLELNDTKKEIQGGGDDYHMFLMNKV